VTFQGLTQRLVTKACDIPGINPKASYKGSVTFQGLTWYGMRWKKHLKVGKKSGWMGQQSSFCT